MAEKTNDPTTQLIFAKYLLETANAFSQNPTSAVVGSMWGLGSTTSKSQKPEPYLVVPPPEDGGRTSSAATSSLASSSNPKTFEATSRYSFSNYPHQQQQSLMNVTMKQQASLNSGKKAVTSGKSESNEQKKKMLEQEGIKWILRLAKQHVPEACYMQAHWMDKEMYGFKKNKVKSLALHQIAARNNQIPESVFAIAEHHYELIQEDDKEAIEPASIVRLYQAAADYGYVNAIYVSIIS